jgi:colicin import membrane protein
MIGRLKNFEMKTASLVSLGLHVAVLGWAMVSFSSSARDAPTPPSLPIDLVSVEDFSKLTKGQKDAKSPEPKPPLAEKKADVPKEVEQAKPKTEEKQKPLETAKADDAPPPAPERKPDAIADKIEKPEPPKPEAKVEPPKPMPPKKPPVKPQPKFDPDKIAALLDKRDSVRETAAGPVQNNTPSLGAASGRDARLSQSEIDALRARLRQCWNPPVGASEAPRLYVVFRVLFKKDGTIARDPTLIEGTASQMGPALGESARRALLQCQPYTMLRPEHYDMWKDMEIKFDPVEMFG